MRMVPEEIYDPEATSRRSSGLGCHSTLRRMKKEWVRPQFFLEFDIKKWTIDRHRLIPILKEEINDPKFFYASQKLCSARLVIGSQRDPDSVPESVVLSTLPAHIYLYKLDQEIIRIRQKHSIPWSHSFSMPLLLPRSEKTGCIDDAGEEGRKESDQDKRRRAAGGLLPSCHSPVSLWHTLHTSLPLRRGQTQNFALPSSLAAFQPSSLLCAAAELTPRVSFPERCPRAVSQNPQKRVPPSPPCSRLASPLGDPSPPCSRLGPLTGSPALRYTQLVSTVRERHEPTVRRRWIAGQNPHNWAMSKKSRGLLIELSGEALLLRSERDPAPQGEPLNCHYSISLSYARYADDLLLGILGGGVELLIEIQKRLAHFLESGLNLGSEGSTRIAARSMVEFPGTVIREVRTTPRPFVRKLEKRLRVKRRIHIAASHLRSTIHSRFRNLGQSLPLLTTGVGGSLLDAVQLAETFATAGVRSSQVLVHVLWGTVKHIRQGSRAIEFLYSSGRSKVLSDQAFPRSGRGVDKFSLSTGHNFLSTGKQADREGYGNRDGAFRREFQIEAPVKKILRRLRERGLISRRRPWPMHVAPLTNVSDGDIVNWSAGIAISPMSYYRCRDNLSQVRTIVDHQIRWAAIFTLAHKHKSSARNIISRYPKDSKIVNREGGKTLAEFPSSVELRKTGSRSTQQRKTQQ